MEVLKNAEQLKQEGYIQLNHAEAVYFSKRWSHDQAKVADSCLENGAWIKHDTGTKYDPHHDSEIWLNVCGRADGNFNNLLFEQVK